MKPVVQQEPRARPAGPAAQQGPATGPSGMTEADDRWVRKALEKHFGEPLRLWRPRTKTEVKR
jgi:hypothetical protein